MSLRGRLVILALMLVPVFRLGWMGSDDLSSPSRKPLVKSTQTVGSTQSVQMSYEKPEPQPFLRAEAHFLYGTHAFSEKDVSIEGNLMGVLANIAFPITGGFQAGFRGEYMAGDVNYDGYYQSLNGLPAQKVKGPGKEQFYDLAGLGYVDVFRDNGSNAAFFTGIAYRSEENEQNFPGGYPREISALYLPLGLNGKVGLSESWAILAEGEFDYLINGKTTSRMSKNRPEDGDVTHTQNSGYGIRAAFRAQYQVSGIGIAVGPYYSYWKVEDSNSVLTRMKEGDRYMIEPANSTTRYGISLGVTY